MKNNIWTSDFLKISIAIIVIALGIFIYLLTRNSYLINNQIRTRAVSQIQQIVKTRAWNAHYGGMYVEKKEGMNPIPIWSILTFCENRAMHGLRP